MQYVTVQYRCSQGLTGTAIGWHVHKEQEQREQGVHVNYGESQFAALLCKSV